jgi:predicted RNA-binding Zn-ribbon protein involved in translation (DUF1610 family)
MNSFRYKLAQWMYGRNGVDALAYAGIVLYFLVFAVNSFVHTIILTVLGYVIVALMFYRMLSRDLTRRRRENEWFLRVFNRVKTWFKRQLRRAREFKTHRYRTCPGCKVNLRLPAKRGSHTVVCPKCGRRVKVRVWV